MNISFLSFITIGILFISANPCTLKTESTTYYLTENGIKDVATIHKTSLQDLQKAFPEGKYVELYDPNYFQFSEFRLKSMSGTFYIYRDTVWAIMLQSPFKAAVLNNVILGSTTLPQFRTLHPELIINKKTNSGSQEMATCEFGNTTLTFFDIATKQYNEKSMIFAVVQIGSMRKPE